MILFGIRLQNILKYFMFHINELIAIGIITILYLFVKPRIHKKLSIVLEKIPEKIRKYFLILKIFYSFPFLFIVFSYIILPFIKGPTDTIRFLLPIFWSLIIFYILNYILTLTGLNEKFPLLKKFLFFLIATLLFYYYLSKPSTSPIYWLLYPIFSIGAKKISIMNIVIVGVFLYFTFYFAKTTRSLISKKLIKDLHLEKSRIENLLVIWEYLVITLGILISLNLIGIRLSSLLIIAGSLGVGIGFGLQTIVNNFLSGIMLLMDRSVNPGDIVTVDNDIGRVVYIGMRYTLIRTFDSQDILIPNYKFIETKVINWTRSGFDLRVHIPFSISYTADPEKAKEIVLEIARSHPRVMAYPPPEVLFLEFGESSLNFELLIWISDLTLGVKNLKSEFNFLIFKAFKENNIEIPYPQIDVHIKKE